MILPRVVACLDVKDGRVVKGTAFRDLADVGDPVELAARYEAEGADEIVLLDVSASQEGRRALAGTVRRTADALFIPLTVGGGVKSALDIDVLLRAGADKVSINTAAVFDPPILTEGAVRFGSQCIVASVDAARERGVWRCYTHGGKNPTELEAVAWSLECEDRGAGELLVTSIDNDGARTGYALDLLKAVCDRARVPVIASGGAGRAEHVRDAIVAAGASAALLAGILHEGVVGMATLKRELSAMGVPVREVTT